MSTDLSVLALLNRVVHRRLAPYLKPQTNDRTCHAQDICIKSTFVTSLESQSISLPISRAGITQTHYFSKTLGTSAILFWIHPSSIASCSRRGGSLLYEDLHGWAPTDGGTTRGGKRAALTDDLGEVSTVKVSPAEAKAVTARRGGRRRVFESIVR